MAPMASPDSMSLSLRLFLKAYRWRSIRPLPWTEPAVPLDRARVALVSSAGMVLPGQAHFDEGYKGGDPSYRVIPADTDPRTLVDTHRSESFDHAGLAQDPNMGFPLDRLREMAADGTVGELAPRHLSFMGSQTAVGRLMKKTAPEAAQLLVEDQVDVALLVPV